MGDAVLADVLRGKTFSNSTGNGLVGTLEYSDIPCIPQQPCYTFAPETMNIGKCWPGKSQINVNDNSCSCIGQTGPQTEWCNRVDDDCDGEIDEGEACLCEIGEEHLVFCEGHGVVDICTGVPFGTGNICCGLPLSQEFLGECYRGVKNVAKIDRLDSDGDGYNPPLDCNDQDPNVHPLAQEYCNGYDDDCDYIIDEGCP